MKCQYRGTVCNAEATKEFDNIMMCQHHYDLWVKFYQYIVDASEGGTKLLLFNGKVYRLNKDKIV